MKRIVILVAMVMALNLCATTANADDHNWTNMTNGDLLANPLVMSRTFPEQLTESQRQRALVVWAFSQTHEGQTILLKASLYEQASYQTWTVSVAKQLKDI